MGKLDELRAMVAETFKNATTPEEIKNQVSINSRIDEIAGEVAEKDKAFVAVKDAYQDALKKLGSVEPPKDAEAQSYKTQEELFNELLSKAKKKQ